MDVHPGRTNRQATPHGDRERPPYGWAALSGGAVFLLYALTLAPTTAFWDTSEYITAAHVLGIPHPPGNPLFVVLSKAWTVLLEPTGLSVAVRVNLFSAFMSATAHAFWFLVVHHVLRKFEWSRGPRLAGAAAAVLVSATAFTVWNQSNVNEKVYTVSLLTIALLSWLVICWREESRSSRGLKILILMAFVLALSVGNHLMAFLAAPALGVFVLLTDPRTLLRWRLYPAIILATLLGLSIHLVLPIRSALNPVMNEAAPECEAVSEALVSVATYGASGCQPLNDVIRRSQYAVEGEPGPGLAGPRQAPLASQMAHYLQYFDWQWARSIDGENPVFATARFPLTLLFFAVGFWGIREHFRRDRPTFWYFLALFGTLSGGLIYYLNFKYGYSLQAPVPDRALHEVRERDYFFVASFSVWGLWAGMGIATLWKQASRAFGGSLARTAPILGLALIPLVVNWSWASRSDDWAARDWAHNLLMSVEPYGVLFTNGDNDTFPLWYLQEVEGIRQDVTVVVTTYFNASWYARQLRDVSEPCPSGVSAATAPSRIVCQRTYTADNTDSVYVHDAAQAGRKVPLLLDRPVTTPTRSVLPLDDDAIERISRTFVRLDREQSVQLGDFTATLREGQLVYPWMQYALAMIADVAGERPVYFSSTGGAAASLGLSAQLVRQGLAFKLRNAALDDQSSSGVVRLTDATWYPVTGRWIDFARTKVLLDQAFVHRSGIPDAWDHWPDHTVSIPHFYAWAYLSAAMAAAHTGDVPRAERYERRTAAWTALGT